MGKARGNAPTRRVDTPWFKTVLLEKKISGRQLAKKMHLDPSAVSLMLRGKRKILIEEAAQLADILTIPIIEVLRHTGLPDIGSETMRRVPVGGTINGKGEVMFTSPKSQAYVDAPNDVPHDGLALVASTAGSKLAYLDGALFFTTAKRQTPAECLQRLCIVQAHGNDSLPFIAAVSRGLARDTYHLFEMCSERPALENARVDWASPVLWQRP